MLSKTMLRQKQMVLSTQTRCGVRYGWIWIVPITMINNFKSLYDSLIGHLPLGVESTQLGVCKCIHRFFGRPARDQPGEIRLVF
jgi:hypothetical protein